MPRRRSGGISRNAMPNGSRPAARWPRAPWQYRSRVAADPHCASISRMNSGTPAPMAPAVSVAGIIVSLICSSSANCSAESTGPAASVLPPVGRAKRVSATAPPSRNTAPRQQGPPIDFFAVARFHVEGSSAPIYRRRCFELNLQCVRRVRFPGRMEKGLQRRQEIAALNIAAMVPRRRSRQPPAAAGRRRWARRRASRT